MNLIKRLKNLWKLSEWEIPEWNKKDFDVGTVITSLVKPPEKSKMAQIIKRKTIDEVEEILKENNEQTNG